MPKSRLRATSIPAAAALLTVIAVAFAMNRSATVRADNDHHNPVVQNAISKVEQGEQTFRFDTFGDESFWGDTLKLHEAIEGSGLGSERPSTRVWYWPLHCASCCWPLQPRGNWRRIRRTVSATAVSSLSATCRTLTASINLYWIWISTESPPNPIPTKCKFPFVRRSRNPPKIRPEVISNTPLISMSWCRCSPSTTTRIRMTQWPAPMAEEPQSFAAPR